MNEDMNEQEIALPVLSDERIGEIESALFAAIERDRAFAARQAETADRRRRARRGRLWLGGAAAAAVIVAAVAIAPAMPSLLGGFGGASDASTAESNPEVARTDGDAGFGDMSGSSTYSGQDAPAAEESGDAPGREIIATASASVRVDDVAGAAESIGDDAVQRGGYVEAMSVGGSRSIPYDDGSEDAAISPVSPSPSDAWITVRVPADELSAATAALGDLGEVTASQIDRRDVTGEAIDLRARIDALQASVDRLTALVADADSTADLIAAEEVLSSRQADLESYQQQLDYLEEQVGMSTLTVSLSAPAPAVAADPAGFGDGIAAGWNGLLAAMNGFVIALGFLLPWIALVAVVVLIAWGIRRLIRRARSQRQPSTGRDLESESASEE